MFRQQMAPQDILRWVNPREAHLADAAAGVIVRFRLGGATFPPQVYYKIFTHRPVTDICAFCPRDYTRRSPPGGQQKEPDSAPVDREGWYVRQENNGWRPIMQVEEAPGASQPHVAHSRKLGGAGGSYHHLSAARRVERRRQRVARQRLWRTKMYLGEGVSVDRADALPTTTDPDDALLAWCAGLDFMDYLQHWSQVACTEPSDGPQEERAAVWSHCQADLDDLYWGACMAPQMAP